MNVLVTGGSGFVGSHVTERLHASGYRVCNYDLRPSRGHPGVRFMEGDICDVASLSRALEGIEVVCHLAGIADVYVALEDPQLAARVNVGGTASVMQAAAKASVSRVIYASTWEVYGHPCYQPADEAHPCQPDHPYGITKYAGERIAHFYGSLYGISLIVLRLGTAYGARIRPTSMFSVFIQKALQGEPIPVHGDGTQVRQFTHVVDIAEAFVAAAECDVRQGTFNIGTTEELTVVEVARMIAEYLPTELRFVPARRGEVAPLRFSSEQAHRVLGWTAKIPFRQGLMQMISLMKAGSGLDGDRR